VEAGISNASLLASLISDQDSYTGSESIKIKSPDVIIVSGDIILGSTDPVNSATIIEKQYEEAREFLNQMVEHFLNGNKHRLVVVPGNHDVDWKYSTESMSPIERSKVFDSSDKVKSQYLRGALSHTSKIRWNWRDLSFYEITDLDKYSKRFDAFARFYHALYEGKRVYSLDPAKQQDIFDLPELNIAIVAYNSCYENDHLQFVGDIHPDCIADTKLAIREFRKKGRLILATWHHNTKGSPYEVNYMDNAHLKSFINSGISVGFHGHQHKTEIISEFSDVVEQKKVIVFSAGTLCAGPKELPTGNNRQYNLVEIVWDDGSPELAITLHTREKTDTSTFNNPIWKAGKIDSNLISYYKVNVDKPEPAEMEISLLEIERKMKNGFTGEAIKDLLTLDLENPFVRKFLVQCLIQEGDSRLALEIFSKPTTDQEFILALQSAIQNGDKAAMGSLLVEASSFNSADATLAILVRKVEAILQ